MGSFRYTWDDFGRGYYFGQLDNRQPKETFTGYNVTVANDDGAIIPVDGLYQMQLTAGSKTFTNTAISVSGSNVTVSTATEHSFSTGDSVTLAGVNQPSLVGTFTITAILSANQFRFSTASPVTPTVFGTSTGPGLLIRNNNIRLPFRPSGSGTTFSASGCFMSSPVVCAGRMFSISVEFDITLQKSLVFAYATSSELVGASVVMPIYRTDYFLSSSGQGYANVCTDPVCVITGNNTIDVYACAGGKVYKWTFNLSTNTWSAITEYTILGMAAGDYVIDLFMWDSRMVAISNTDKLWFSDALTYSSWPAINYLAPGSSSDKILAAVPRNDDLYVFKPSGVFVVSGVLGASSYVRRYSNGVNINQVWLNSITEYGGQIFYISKDIYDPNFINGKIVNIRQSIGSEGVAAYYNFGERKQLEYKYNAPYYQASNISDYPAIATTANDHLVVMFSTPTIDPDYYNERSITVMDFGSKVWSKRRYAPLATAYNYYYRYAPARTNSYVDDLSYTDGRIITQASVPFFQISHQLADPAAPTPGGSPIEVAIGHYPINQNGAGVYWDLSSPVNPGLTEGVFISSPYASQIPSKINRVYIEADIYNDIGDPAKPTEKPWMQVQVFTSAVDDIEFLNSKTFNSTPINYTANDVATIGDNRTTRVLRFDTNDTGYGYKHNIAVAVKGMRIKSMWAEGDNRS